MVAASNFVVALGIGADEPFNCDCVEPLGICEVEKSLTLNASLSEVMVEEVGCLSDVVLWELDVKEVVLTVNVDDSDILVTVVDVEVLIPETCKVDVGRVLVSVLENISVLLDDSVDKALEVSVINKNGIVWFMVVVKLNACSEVAKVGVSFIFEVENSIACGVSTSVVCGTVTIEEVGE